MRKLYILLLALTLLSCAVAVRDAESDYGESKLPSENEVKLLSEFENSYLEEDAISVFEKRSLEKVHEMFELLSIIGDQSYDSRLRKNALAGFSKYFTEENNIKYQGELLSADIFLEKIYSGEIKLENVSTAQSLTSLSLGPGENYNGKIGFSLQNNMGTGQVFTVLARTSKSFGEDKKLVWEIFFTELVLFNDDEP